MDSPQYSSPPRPPVDVSPFSTLPVVCGSGSSSLSPSPQLNPQKRPRTWRVFDENGGQMSRSTEWRRKIVFQENAVDTDPVPAVLPALPPQPPHQPLMEIDDVHADSVLFEENAVDTDPVPAVLPALPPQPPHQPHTEIDDVYADSLFSRESSDSDSFREESSCSEAYQSSEDESAHHPQEMEQDSFDSESNFSDSDSDSDSEVFEVWAGCSFSVDEAVLDLFTDNLENRETKKSLGDSLKTFLKYLPPKNNMPKTLTQLLNYVEQLAPAYKETSHPYCAECLLFLRDILPCPACASVERNFFYTFSLSEQIKYYFEVKNLWEVLDMQGCKQSTDGKIRDITDGTEYIRVKLNDKYSLTLVMNTDGVSIADSSGARIWPVMFVIVEVPPQLRVKFLIVSGVWCDSKDAPMSTLLKPIVTELRSISDNGGVSWTHPRTGIVHKSSITVPVVCADAPARAKLQNVTGHNGNVGCNTCVHERDFIPLSLREERKKAAGLTVKRKKTFYYMDPPARLRTKLDMLQQAREAFDSRPRRDVQGIKGPSILSLIPALDISTCVYAEYMHGTCIGVVKHFLTLWLTVPGPWNISRYKRDLDRFMKNLRPTCDICRLPKPVSKMSEWKASEFRSWLLYYSLPALSGKLPKRYLDHWALLVNALFLLLQEEISQDNLDAAQLMINCFVRDVSTLYRLRDNLYNVHQLIHLPLYVKWWGPLWCNSAFFFESYNRTLVNLIHGTKNRGKELMRNVRIAHGVEVLRNIVNHNKNVTMPQEQGKEFVPVTLCRTACVPECDKPLLLDRGVACPPQGVIYSAVKRGKVLFTSKLFSRTKRRSNHSVRFKLGLSSAFGDIRYFISSEGSLFAVIERLRVDQTRMYGNDELNFRVKHIIPVDSTGSTIVINAKDIIKKMIRVDNILTYKPNCYENNL